MMWQWLVAPIAIVVFYQRFPAYSETTSLIGDHYSLNLKCEMALQAQINEEMYASIVYMNMAAYYDRNSVARKGLSRFYKESSLEERGHAQLLIDYINKRGGTVKALNIQMPDKYNWNSILESLKDALRLEKFVNDKLYKLHKLAQDTCYDAHLTHFLEEKFLEEQVHSIDQLNRYIAVLSCMNEGLGEFHFDRQLQEENS